METEKSMWGKMANEIDSIKWCNSFWHKIFYGYDVDSQYEIHCVKCKKRVNGRF